MKIQLNPAGIEPVTFRIVEQHLNHCATAVLYNGYRVFPEGKVRPDRAADHSPPSSAAVVEQ